MRKLYGKEERVCGDEMLKLIEQCGIHPETVDEKVMYYVVIEDTENIIEATYGSDRWLTIDLAITDALEKINGVGRKLSTEGLISMGAYTIHPEIQIFRMMKGDRSCLIKVDDFDIRLRTKFPTLTWLALEARCDRFKKPEEAIPRWLRISLKGYPIAEAVENKTILEVQSRVEWLEKTHPGFEFHYDGDEKAILGKPSDELKKELEEKKKDNEFTGV